MARPRKRTVDYFPHECKHGKTLDILESKYGNDGYAFWFKLLETLGTTEGHFYDFSKPEFAIYLSSKVKLSEEKCEEILDLLARLQVIDTELWEEKQLIWSQNFVDNIEDVYRTRNTNCPTKEGIIREKEGCLVENTEKTGVNSTENTQSKLKETKLKEKKEKESIKEAGKSSGLKEKANQVFQCWNETQAGVKHRNLTPPMKKSVNARLKDGYSVKELNQAIQNLSKALNDDSYYWTHRWTLQEFLSRGQGAQIDKFLDGIDDMLKDGAKKQSGGNGKMSLNEWMDFKGYEGQPNQDHILEYEGRYQN